MDAAVRMSRRAPRGPAALMVAALVAMLCAAPAARADTTVIGEQTLQSNVPLLNATGQSIPVFQGDAGSGYVLASPRTGTITSFSFMSGGVATGQQFELDVLAPVDQGGQTWQLQATSNPVAVTTATNMDAVNGPFPVQIPIAAGERIALVPVDGQMTPAETGTPGVDGTRTFAAPFSGVDSSQSVVPGSDDGNIIPVQATVAFTGQQLAPQNTKLPSISGTVRQFEPLTGDEGLWQNGVSSFKDTWLRCAPDGSACQPIPGATTTNYTPTRDDVGFPLRFQVVASNAGGDSPPAISAATAPVARGVTTAKLSITPNPSCTGVPTTLSGAGSFSPDGIKSYSFSMIDLWAAAQNTASSHLTVIDSESQAEFTVAVEAGTLIDGGGDAQFLIDNFSSHSVVSSTPNITQTFDYDREAVFNPDDPATPNPGALARDPVGIVLTVTDFAGHTARALSVLDFAQLLSSGSRTKCPKLRRLLLAPNTVLLAALRFSKSGQAQMKAGCRTRVTCIGSVTVSLRVRSGRAADGTATRVRRRLPQVIAGGFFRIPPHKKRTVRLSLTKLGKRLLHRGAHLPVTVTVTSVSATGHSVHHSYAQTLRR